MFIKLNSLTLDYNKNDHIEQIIEIILSNKKKVKSRFLSIRQMTDDRFGFNELRYIIDIMESGRVVAKELINVE